MPCPRPNTDTIAPRIKGIPTKYNATVASGELPDDQFMLYLATQLEKWTALPQVYSMKDGVFAVARHETKKQALHEYASFHYLL
jgi:hypothetical protein